LPHPNRFWFSSQHLLIIVATSALGFTQGAIADGPPAITEFDHCKTNLAIKAREVDISEPTIDEVFAQLKEIPRVVVSDRSQPEFTQTFTEYYGRRVTAKRVETGREMLEQHRELLNEITAETGVPAHYLISFWGLETNFGSYFGTLSIPSALATLACEGRRREFFTKEFLATLKIIDNGDIEASKLIGSWAGAIGHMQFMPTTYLAHAKDGDGDGRRDLLDNIDDALTSGAHYLADLGWSKGYRWGREVTMPEEFDYSTTGSHQWRSIKEWAEMGVMDAFGNRLSRADIKAALLIPTGHTGPAFLVYDNFKIIMNWNRSEFYALSVGRLADRIAGAGQLQRSLPDTKEIRVATEDVIQLQRQLNQLGYNTGKPDGIIGPATRRAVQQLQAERGVIADGHPNREVLELAKAAPSGTSP